MTKLEDLGFYCIDCGEEQNFNQIESEPNENAGIYKKVFICRSCGCYNFEIYSTTKY